MSLSVGIVGLPNAGKSTLFNALVERQNVKTGKHPFTTVEPNQGTVNVPNKRLEELALLCGAKIKTPVRLTFIDIAGLIEGAHQGEGLGNRFLAHIREVDCILQVARVFEDPTIPHIHGEVDPRNDLEIVRTELIFKDIDTVEKQLNGKKSGWIKETGEKGMKVLRKIRQGLNNEVAIRDMDLKREERKLIGSLCFLTDKPEVVVYNLGENQIDREKRDERGDLHLCAKLEEELAGLKWAEQRQYLKEFGLPEPALNRVISACYRKLDLLTFYTIAGGKEARAWALPRGSSVFDGAGRIHTDMQKRFIKAEVVNADELLKIGSWTEAGRQGKISLQGRDYIVHDHDVISVKFN